MNCNTLQAISISHGFPSIAYGTPALAGFTIETFPIVATNDARSDRNALRRTVHFSIHVHHD
jgi:hypothetical protein